jgi:hypothetical protein
VEALELARRQNPLSADVRLDLSAAYEALGRPDAALEVLERLLVLHPGHLFASERAAALVAKLHGGRS